MENSSEVEEEEEENEEDEGEQVEEELEEEEIKGKREVVSGHRGGDGADKGNTF
jgi:hypothetical protein